MNAVSMLPVSQRNSPATTRRSRAAKVSRRPSGERQFGSAPRPHEPASRDRSCAGSCSPAAVIGTVLTSNSCIDGEARRPPRRSVFRRVVSYSGWSCVEVLLVPLLAQLGQCAVLVHLADDLVDPIQERVVLLDQPCRWQPPGSPGRPGHRSSRPADRARWQRRWTVASTSMQQVELVRPACGDVLGAVRVGRSSDCFREWSSSPASSTGEVVDAGQPGTRARADARRACSSTAG